MSRSFLTALILTLLLSSQTLASQAQLLGPSKDNSPTCSCYLTSGPSPGYFQYHRFFDFRSIPTQYLPSSNSSSDSTSNSTSGSNPAPQLVTSSTTDMDPTNSNDVTSSFFETEEWIRDWSIQNFSTEDASTDGKYRQVASPRNIWIESDCGGGGNTCLVLRSSREEEEFQSVAEVDSNQANLW